MELRRILRARDAGTPNAGQGYFPADIKRLYNIPSTLTGKGQTIGILEFSNGYNLRDAQQFWRMHGIQPPAVTFVSVDGTPNDRGTSANDEEATLDLQWAGAIAPGAQIVVYEANGGSTYKEFAQSVTNTLQYILNDMQYHPSVLSISYGDAESSFDPADITQWAALVKQLDAKGITVCVSSGDQGAYGMHDLNEPKIPHADAPASLPNAIAVGGTSLQPDGTESAWTYLGSQNGGATGGGFSSIFTKPSYQSVVPGKERGIPDISCNADPATGYQIIFQGQSVVVGGTSVSCPVFAAVVALANEQREQQGLKALSGLAQALYASGVQGSYRDITTGNNSFNGVTGYAAVPGWDASTGLGSFDATKLISYLTSVTTSSGSTNPSGNGNPSGGGTGTAGSGTPSPTPQPNPVPVRKDPLPPPPAQDKNFMVRVKAVIQKVEHDASHSGAHHHHLLIDGIEVLKVWNGTQIDVANQAFVAIRYGDSEGLSGPIPNLQAGNEIVLQGNYIPAAEAYPGAGNPGEAVIHETHHPFGFVLYEGQMYK